MTTMEPIFLHLPTILSFTALQIAGLVSPGPDLAITIRNSLIYSRKTGLLTAIGVFLGTMMHVTYIIVGVEFLIDQIAWLASLLKYLGAGYLLYVGFKGLQAKKNILPFYHSSRRHDISRIAALRIGFLTSAFNPMVMLYFVSIFSVFLSPTTPTLVIFTYWIIIFISTLLWLTLVAFCFSHKSIYSRLSSITHWLDRITGGLLMLLGVKLLFTRF